MTQPALFDFEEYEVSPDEWGIAHKHVFVSFSGGKDSVTAFLVAREQYPAHIIELVFCDTGDEAKETYEYVQWFHHNVHPVTRLATELLGFNEKGERMMRRVPISIDMSLEEMRQRYYTVYDAIRDKQSRQPHLNPFPSLKSRHCTRDLKVNALDSYIISKVPLNERHLTVLVIGIRRAESTNRSKQRMFVHDPDRGNIDLWYPIVNYTTEDVWAKHFKYWIKPNPVYDIEARSNCVGCVFSNPLTVRRHIDRHGKGYVQNWVQLEQDIGYKLWGDVGISDVVNMETPDAKSIFDSNPLFCDSGYCDVG